jgi:hypothetical protein
MLALESYRVINLRLMKMAAGGQVAYYEAFLMVNEKIDALFEAGGTLATGGTPEAIIDRYRQHVAANFARLGAPV